MKHLKKVKRFLLAPKTVITLIIITGLFCIAGILIPQASYRGDSYYQKFAENYPYLSTIIDAIGLDRLFSTYWFLTFVSVLGISLSLTVWEQFARRLRAMSQTIDLEKINYADGMTRDGVPDGLKQQLIDILHKKGYRLKQTGQKENLSFLLFDKHDLGRWGAAILHLGLLIIILGALYGLAFHSSGFARVMVDEVIPGTPESFLEKEKGSFAPDLDLGFSFKLQDFSISYWDDNSKKEMMSLLIIPGDAIGKEYSLPMSNPFKYKGITFYQSLHYGYAVTFVLKRKGLHPVSTHFLTDPVKGAAFATRDTFALTDYLFEIVLIPDTVRSTRLLNNPEVKLRINRDKDILFSGTIKHGETISFNGNDLVFTDIRYWSGITVLKGYVVSFVYTGFWLATFGLALIYILSPQRLAVRLEKSVEKSVTLSFSLTGNMSPDLRQKELSLIKELIKQH